MGNCRVSLIPLLIVPLTASIFIEAQKQADYQQQLQEQKEQRRLTQKREQQQAYIRQQQQLEQQRKEAEAYAAAEIIARIRLQQEQQLQQQQRLQQSLDMQTAMKSLNQMNQVQSQFFADLYGLNDFGYSGHLGYTMTPIRSPYSGQCNCPYDTFYYNGQQRICGDNSAYVRTGGREPVCFVGE
ncbi:hypothetical protein [Picosynechococcus sp. PCC 11901]|uniref:hypothetical protein n=1 Tax=Picosynechococcus sp. PCC 11901 TaxID=2579791 RepID=UPI0010FE2A02|nr:hypothetical protein [Picosynechococcus sp. PCC 11901]